jgi:K+/H+ antiporter YhaU regulatory subunit KhtT
VAVRDAEDGTYTYSPGPDFLLEARMTLVVIGKTDAVQRRRRSSLFTERAETETETEMEMETEKTSG